MACELCAMEKLAEWRQRYADEDFLIADCRACKDAIILLYREHKIAIHAIKEAQGRIKLTRVADEVFGKGNWYFDSKMGLILKHWHLHARKK